MIIEIIKADGQTENTVLSAMKMRMDESSEMIDASVRLILDDIKANGFESVEKYSKRFDKVVPFEVTKEQIEEAYKECDKDLIEALELSAKNIHDYHSQMLVKSWEYNPQDGITLGQNVRGLSKVGIYVPGGTAAYPSSVLMNAIPAKVAGVEEIIMVTPPTENLNNAVLAAAKIAGVDRILAVGGVQAICALTLGAGFIPKVDKIVGPGNAYVASAKKQVFGKVDIDMIAGPSEVLVIADDSANPCYIAADMLSQAEHDKLASAILVTDSEDFANKVAEELEKQTQTLSREEIIRISLRDHGKIIVCDNLIDCAKISNEVAPEHLEIVTKNDDEVLPLIKNAGAIFLGQYSPEPLGDYMAGPSHVLPTSGSARFFSPLSTDTFLKKSSVVKYSKTALLDVADKIMNIAQTEKLTAHANSIKVRCEK